MDALLIFVKYPEPGKVKTRLARRVGSERAATLYHEMVEQVIEQTSSEQYQRILCYDPPQREAEFRQWLPQLHAYVPQWGGGLGERLSHALEPTHQAYQKVAVIGTDCVELSDTLIGEAFMALDSHDLVMGPALDGGYYLLAAKQFYPELFSCIAWSTEQVLRQTLERASALGLKVKQLPVLADIDE